jgi:hypothetical protein
MPIILVHSSTDGMGANDKEKKEKTYQRFWMVLKYQGTTT